MDKNSQLETATFAGGCFWCIEAGFEKIDGVAEAVSGYSGGEEENPGYEAVSSGKTGHYEAVQVRFDSEKISYGALVDAFFRQIDPTDDSGSFVDRGDQYRSALFYHDEQQKRQALAAIEEINGSGRFDKPVATKVVAFKKFYP
ncbi:MAG: peptide-methionine (S)-S-oxide reductase MsrA, partial [Desulfobacteraceae bacterium]